MRNPLGIGLVVRPGPLASMAGHQPIVLLLLVLLVPAPQANAINLGEWRTLLSLSHSLMTRVSNARAARGDTAGAERAHKIADHLGLLTGRGIWSAGWDFAWNYAWRGGDLPTVEIYRSAADLLAAIGEVARMESSAERAGWALRNYGRLLSLSNSLLQTLLRAFSQSGPLRDAVLVMRQEVVEGELLKDCLEVAAGDLEGLVRIARDIFSSATSRDSEL